MKSAKQLMKAMFLVAVFASLLTISASAKKVCDNLTGTGSASTTFTVTTGSKTPTLKLKQKSGTADYTTVINGTDNPKSAKMFGGFTIVVQSTEGETYKNTILWNCTKNVNIPLKKNGTFKIEVTPWAMNEVFCTYIDKHEANALRYAGECTYYEGTWTTAPVWSVKTEKGITSCEIQL